MACCSKPKIAKIDLVRNHRFFDVVDMATFVMHKSAARGNPVLMPPDLAIRSRDLDLYAAYARNRRLPSKVRAFIDFATEKVYRRQSHRLF